MCFDKNVKKQFLGIGKKRKNLTTRCFINPYRTIFHREKVQKHKSKAQISWELLVFKYIDKQRILLDTDTWKFWRPLGGMVPPKLTNYDQIISVENGYLCQLPHLPWPFHFCGNIQLRGLEDYGLRNSIQINALSLKFSNLKTHK